MTLTLTINEKEYTAKASFAFLKSVQSLGQFTEQTGKIEGGLEALITALVSNDIDSLVDFWSAATAHYGKKDKPTREQIETSLENIIEGGKDIEELFKEAYKFMRESGFFKKRIKLLWEQIEMMKTSGTTEEKKQENEQTYEQFMKMKAEIEE